MKIKLILLIAIFITSLPLSAKSDVDPYLENQYSKNAIAAKSWNSISIGYNVTDMWGSNMSGVKLEYTRASLLSKDYPLFIDYGVTGRWLFNLEQDWATHFVDVTIPVNVGYKLQLDDRLGFYPYFGAHIKTYLLGEDQCDGKWEDLFNNNDFSLQRVQFGLQLGVDLHVNKMIFGIGYSHDLTDLDSEKIGIVELKAGFKF